MDGNASIEKGRMKTRSSLNANGSSTRPSLRRSTANKLNKTIRSTANLRNAIPAKESNVHPSSSVFDEPVNANGADWRRSASRSPGENHSAIVESDAVPSGDLINPNAENSGSQLASGTARNEAHLNASINREGTESGLSSEDVAEQPILPITTRRGLSGRRNSRHSGRRDMSVNATGDNRVHPTTQNDSVMVNSEMQVAHNKVKLDLLEALRDKKAYSSAMIALKEQKESMEKEMRVLTQKNLALESALNSTKRFKGGKKPVWSMDNLRDSNIANYQGICLAAGDIAKKEAMLVTTETYVDERDHGTRKRNWTGSSTKVSNDEAKKAIVYVTLCDGSFGIPTSCMERAKKHDHYVSPHLNDKGFAAHCIEATLASPVGSMMNNDEKRECLSLILSHRQTLRKFKSILSDSIGNRKKVTFGLFLRSLGYSNGAKANSDQLTSSQKMARKLEREIAYDKCVRIDNDGNIDTMYWRLTEWSQLCLEAAVNSNQSREMEESEKQLEKEGVLDNLFMNEAARRAYTELKGHNIPESNDRSRADVSILSLARADAAMTTMLKWIKVGGRGGVRNSNFNDCFRSLLPKAMEAIIQEVWDDLKALVPHELFPSLAGAERTETDIFGNESREWTCVFQSPDDNYLYLLAKPDYFSEKVCSWLGKVCDCCIGICRPNESVFTRIHSDTTVLDIEESDIDEDVDEGERAVEINENNGGGNENDRMNIEGK